MTTLIKTSILYITAILLYTSCDSQSSSITNDDTISIVSDDAGTPSSEREKKEFTSSFENVEDFDGFYITPQDYLGTTSHELSEENVRSGVFSHRAWIDGPNLPSADTNNNHRGYPTVQFQNTSQGVFTTPCYVTLWVWLDMELETHTGSEDDWFSFATYTDDETDNWARTVLVNLSADGFVHLQHTTNQGDQTSIFQTTDITFPQREWVELKMYLDFRDNGYAKVWQNGQLVSHSEIGNITNKLSQAHFGLYAPPQIGSGVVFNEDLVIREVDGE